MAKEDSMELKEFWTHLGRPMLLSLVMSLVVTLVGTVEIPVRILEIYTMLTAFVLVNSYDWFRETFEITFNIRRRRKQIPSN